MPTSALHVARTGLEAQDARMRVWLCHGLWSAIIVVWIIVVCGLPLWLYAFGFVYLGTSLSLVRSFAEHRAEDAVEKRTAIVENSPVLGLL